MLTPDTIHYSSISEIGKLFRNRTLSPVSFTEDLLDRIEKLDPSLHAFKIVTRKRALAEANAAEIAFAAGRDLSPLQGIPYAAKDIYDVQGLPTGAGTRLLDGNIATEDSMAIRLLSQAGMVLLGKTHTVQLAFGAVGINHDQGTPHNPWHSTPHSPGGSSSGSGVAVASGLAPIALGSDTGGSVRIPASLCGIVGLKTTIGRVSRTGVYPLSWTLDSVGPLTRTVHDAALVFDSLVGFDPADDTTRVDGVDVLTDLERGVNGLRIAFCESLLFREVDSEIESAVREAGETLRSLGAHLTSVKVSEVEESFGHEERALFVSAEACSENGPLLKEHFDQLDPIVSHPMRQGRTHRATDYFRTLRKWSHLRRKLHRTLSDIDILLGPTTPIPAFPIEEIDADMNSYEKFNALYSRNTAVGNILGLCGISLPCGFTSQGLPIGLMIYAKPFQEQLLLRAAFSYEQASDWSKLNPDLSWIK